MNQQSNDAGPIGRACSYLGQAWLVILLAVLYGGALAGVQSSLGPTIEENRRRETYDRIPELVEGADQSQTREILVADANGKKCKVYQAVAADGTSRGWVVPASGLGFADRIDLLIGLSLDTSTITGLYVLDQKETPALGSNITSNELFLDQFAGKSAEEPLAVIKGKPAVGGNGIRALSGATISSESVADIVNQTLGDLREPIRQIPPEAAPAPSGVP